MKNSTPNSELNGPGRMSHSTYPDLPTHPGLRRFLARCARWLGLRSPRPNPASAVAAIVTVPGPVKAIPVVAAAHAATIAVDAAHEAQIASARATLVLIEEAVTLIDLLEQAHAEWPTARQSELGVLLLDDLRPDFVELADDLRRHLADNGEGITSTDEALALDSLRKGYRLLDQCEADLAEMM